MATTLGFIPLQLIPTNTYNFDKMPVNGTYVVVKTPTVAQQLQLTKSLKEMKEGKEINNNVQSKPVVLRCKRRVDFTGLGCKIVDPENPSVSRRNERERRRVKMVNNGFETLRQHVPSGRKNKKMSKVETLRSAVQYIRQLQGMLDAHDTAVTDLLTTNVDLLEEQVAEMMNCVSDDSPTSSTASSASSVCSEPPMQVSSESLSQQAQQVLVAYSQSAAVSANYYQTDNSSYSQTPVTFNTFEDNQNVGSYSQSQTSTGSLHSPTSSVVSDSSYDSVGDSAGHEDDLMGFTNWF